MSITKFPAALALLVGTGCAHAELFLCPSAEAVTFVQQVQAVSAAEALAQVSAKWDDRFIAKPKACYTNSEFDPMWRKALADGETARPNSPTPYSSTIDFNVPAKMGIGDCTMLMREYGGVKAESERKMFMGRCVRRSNG